MSFPTAVVRRARSTDRLTTVHDDVAIVPGPSVPVDLDDGFDDEPGEPSKVRRTASRVLRVLRRSIGLVAVIVFWQWVSARQWWHGNIPTPHQVWDALLDLERAGQLWPNVSASLGRVGKGLLIGGSLGLAAGVVSGLFRLGEDVIDAPFQVMRMLPSLALAPLFIIWFGIGDTAKINLIAVGVFAPMYLNTYHGIRGIDSRHIEAATSFGLRRPALIAHVIIPGALPQILVGIRQALAVSWFTLVVAEQIRNDRGLGTLMTDAQQYFRTDVMFVVLAIYGLLGLMTDVFVRLLERKALAWRRSFVGA